MKDLNAKQFCYEINISLRTLKYHLSNGYYPWAYKTVTGMWRFPYNEVLKLKHMGADNKSVLYVRISGTKDRNIDDQSNKILEWCKNRNISILNIYKDIGSGLNENRKGLKTLMEDAKQRKFNEILILHKDRLTRFGFSYLEQYFNSYDIRITIIEDSHIKEDYVKDLVDIMTSFCAKIYGRRSTKIKTLKAIEDACA